MLALGAVLVMAWPMCAAAQQSPVPAAAAPSEPAEAVTRTPAAQRAIPPDLLQLQCQRAQVVLKTRPCPNSKSCQAGTTPGLAQLQEVVPVHNAAGRATVLASAPAGTTRTVNFRFKAGDVRQFAPDGLAFVSPSTTQLWVISLAELPPDGPAAKDIMATSFTKHRALNPNLNLNYAAKVDGTHPLAFNEVRSPWIVVGQVKARMVPRAGRPDNYGFVCTLPLETPQTTLR